MFGLKCNNIVSPNLYLLVVAVEDTLSSPTTQGKSTIPTTLTPTAKHDQPNQTSLSEKHQSKEIQNGIKKYK